MTGLTWALVASWLAAVGVMVAVAGDWLTSPWATVLASVAGLALGVTMAAHEDPRRPSC